MDAKTIFEWTISYGLGTVLAIGAAFALWRILFYVLRENSKREERLAGIIEKNLRSVEDGLEAAKEILVAHEKNEVEWIKQILEALRFQRQEHEKIVEVLSDLKVR